MKKLTFDREATRQEYLRADPSLKRNKRRLELLLLRLELLARNPLFLREWEAVNEEDGEWIEDKWNAFVKRWHVLPRGITLLPTLRDQAVEELLPEKKDEQSVHTLSLKVDLRYSKRRILAAIEDILDKQQEILDYARNFRDILREDSSEEMLRRAKDGKVSTDPKDYLKALEVWDLREVKKASWSEIQKQLKLNNLQAGRNWHKKACELIKAGVPTLPSFPEK